MLADQDERGGRFTEAAEFWRKALAAARTSGSPLESGIRQSLASTLEHGRMWDELIELQRGELAETGTDQARTKLAETYRKAGRARQAAQVWADALAETQRQDPPDAKRISWYRGKLAEAYQLGDSGMNLSRSGMHCSPRQMPRQPDSGRQVPDQLRTQLAAAQLQAGHDAEAITILQKSVTDARTENDGDPWRTDACLAHLATVYDQIGRYGESLGVLRQRYAEARDVFGAAGPRTIQAGRDLAAAEVRSRDFAAAITLLRDLTAQPTPPRLCAVAHSDLGRALLFDDQVVAAEAEYRKAAKHANAEDRQVFAAQLSFVLRLLGRLPEAEEVLREHYAFWMQDDQKARLAHVLILRGHFDDAERLLADTSRDPQDGWPRALLALARGKTAQAVEECTLLARHQPGWWLMAHLVARPGDAGSLPTAESAVALNPRAKPGYYLPPFSRAEVAALTLSIAGRPADGARLLERAVPLRLPGERWHRPVYHLLKSRTGADLGGIQEIWESVRRQDPQCIEPWNSYDE